ncbi:TldD/PmbA family protein [Bacillus sp. H-16]|uniref:TldD/PmbA family protein n=1 Tax=Alteribacter salitolerans TaxID=2912333 RepID=UPI0019623E73|nr:TldD/PmbA family protein [Alteribacter salitolerans]MBM7094398.1 TldD/PmbA family protein [Alteribacter salitolerans]
MEMTAFKERLFKAGSKAGFEEMELYYVNGEKFSTKVYENEVDSYTVANDGGLSFRGLIDGQMGYAYTEKIDETSIDLLVQEAKENLGILDTEDREDLFEGSSSYPQLDLYAEKLEQITPQEKIAFLKELEKACKDQSEKVSSVNYCMLQSFASEKRIANSKGLDVQNKGNAVYVFVSVVVKEKEDIKSAQTLKVSRDFSKFDAGKIAEEVVAEALSYLGAEPVKSGQYPVIFKNKAAASLFQTFVGSFSAENVQKGKSRLAGKLGEKVAGENITVIDNPHDEKRFSSRSFDSEGVPTKPLNVIENGVLQTFLHNRKTAKKDGVSPTGHASKASYKGTIGISPSNMTIKAGKKSYDDLISESQEAVVITDLQGLHSGANPISGDFSLAAHGYLVKAGKIVRPVNQITVAGNFFTLLQQMEEVGSDLEIELPSGGSIGSPSLKVANLSIGGK